MPSPFSGMDPWLEARNCSRTCAKADRLPERGGRGLVARTLLHRHRHEVVRGIPAAAHRAGCRCADTESASRAASDGGVAVLGKPKPLVFRVADDPIREWVLEIRRSDSGDRFVTSVEVLSLSNELRETEGRKQYLKKRRELREGKVNVFEIDLLRAGAPTMLAPIVRTERRAGPFEFHICARRYYRSLSTEVYPIPMQERLPLIAVPLLKGDPDITVDLQAVFDRSYAVALFGRRVDYSKPCDPPLTPEQQAWAEGILKVKGVP